MEIWRQLTQRDVAPQPVRCDPDKERRFWENLSLAEREVITRYIVALQVQRVQLEGVDLLVLGVGSYAKQVRGGLVRPKDIDLRVVTSAPPESELQERVVLAAEKVTKDHLDAEAPDYIQLSGFKWHLVEASSGGRKTEMIPFVDYDSNDIRFVVGARKDRRPIDIMISGHNRLDIESHLAKEAELGNKPVILVDTREVSVFSAS